MVSPQFLGVERIGILGVQAVCQHMMKPDNKEAQSLVLGPGSIKFEDNDPLEHAGD